MNEQKIKQAYDYAVERYAAIGVDVEKAMEQLQNVQLSLHCWIPPVSSPVDSKPVTSSACQQWRES